jgi:Na+-translocating ferredoxin:NAD+ oxidoreductase RnfG subunit
MRNLKSTALFFAVILCVSGLLQAGTNKYGVGDVRKVILTAPTRVGDVLLPQGDYEVRHVMEAENHTMVFKQLGTTKPAEARVKCNLVPLKEKADQTQVIYQSNAANERVLRILRFRGDLAEHVF